MATLCKTTPDLYPTPATLAALRDRCRACLRGAEAASALSTCDRIQAHLDRDKSRAARERCTAAAAAIAEVCRSAELELRLADSAEEV